MNRFVAPMILIGIAIAAPVGQLTYEFLHGGIVSHHWLNDPKQPAISNLWGLLVLPVLAGLCCWRLWRASEETWRTAIRLMLAMALFGAVFSVCFAYGFEQPLLGMLAALLLSAAYFKLYRAEASFGFVLGMMWVFGPVLPLLPVIAASMISAISHKLVVPAVRRWRATSK
jgi:hypothetical protein